MGARLRRIRLERGLTGKNVSQNRLDPGPAERTWRLARSAVGIETVARTQDTRPVRE